MPGLLYCFVKLLLSLCISVTQKGEELLKVDIFTSSVCSVSVLCTTFISVLCTTYKKHFRGEIIVSPCVFWFVSGISCVQFDDNRIVSGSSDKTIKVRDCTCVHACVRACVCVCAQCLLLIKTICIADIEPTASGQPELIQFLVKFFFSSDFSSQLYSVLVTVNAVCLAETLDICS